MTAGSGPVENATHGLTAERRYGECTVQLTNSAGEQLSGQQFALYPVDEPPLIDVPSVSVRWYREVWEARGWTVTAFAPGSECRHCLDDPPVGHTCPRCGRRTP